MPLQTDCQNPTAHSPSQVHVYTAHHDPSHCFEETLCGDFTVVVAGGWFPRHVLHRAMALCAYIRCLLAALWLAWTSFRRAGHSSPCKWCKVLLGTASLMHYAQHFIQTAGMLVLTTLSRK